MVIAVTSGLATSLDDVTRALQGAGIMGASFGLQALSLSSGHFTSSVTAKGLSDIRIQENKICAALVAFRVLTVYSPLK